MCLCSPLTHVHARLRVFIHRDEKQPRAKTPSSAEVSEARRRALSPQARLLREEDKREAARLQLVMDVESVLFPACMLSPLVFAHKSL